MINPLADIFWMILCVHPCSLHPLSGYFSVCVWYWKGWYEYWKRLVSFLTFCILLDSVIQVTNETRISFTFILSICFSCILFLMQPSNAQNYTLVSQSWWTAPIPGAISAMGQPALSIVQRVSCLMVLQEQYAKRTATGHLPCQPAKVHFHVI